MRGAAPPLCRAPTNRLLKRLERMTRHRFAQTGRERAQALVAAIAINLGLGAAFVAGLAFRAEQRGERVIDMFDISLPPPPPPTAIERPKADAPNKPEGAAGKKAEASPVVALPSPIPAPSPVVAAPVPAQGNAASAGAATAGSGPGAGGSGSGAGGGGSGGIGTEARLLGGHRARLPRALLRAIPQDQGYAHLLLTVGTAGRVTNCRVLTSSGYPAIDAALCDVMVNQSRWSAARDRAGRPIAVDIRYTGTWTKR
jgi:protein TonB